MVIRVGRPVSCAKDPGWAAMADVKWSPVRMWAMKVAAISPLVFVLFGNLSGLIPGGFTFTSHIAVTFTMAAIIFPAVTVIGIFRHGFHFRDCFS